MAISHVAVYTASSLVTLPGYAHMLKYGIKSAILLVIHSVQKLASYSLSLSMYLEAVKSFSVSLCLSHSMSQPVE